MEAQEDFTGLSKSKLKKFALEAEKNGDHETASIYLSKYLEEEPEAISMSYKLAESYRHLGAYEKAMELYQSVSESKKADQFPLSKFYQAEMLVATGKCETALPIYERFRKEYKGEEDDRKYRKLAKSSMEGCESHNANGDNSKEKFIIKKLGESINSNQIEGAPIHLKDDQWIYNSLKSEKTVFESHETLPKRYFYTFDNKEENAVDLGKWDVLENFKEAEVANGAFNKNRNRFYFSAYQPNALGKISCDIYKIEKKGEQWSAPEKLPESINSRYTETQVAVGVDEKGRETIYFVSDRKEGKGGLDIWYSTYYEKKGEYREAKNCGSKVNSVGDEITPFINPLNNKLYYSSNGLPGFGQFDVFTTSGQRSKWQEPENAGAWINSRADELYFAIHPKDGEGIFASNREKKGKKKFCCDDLYYFKEKDKIRISVVGIVEAEDKKLPGAQVSLYQINEEGERIFLQSNLSDQSGHYELILEPNQKYYMQAKKEGYLVEEKSFETINSLQSKKYEMNFKLSPKTDRVFIIENIYYAFDRAEITKESEITIDTTIFEILTLNPEVIVEIGSHTDSKGSDAYNMKLSQQRAESVVKYLRKRGISKERIVAKGYGEERPIAPNQHEDGSDNPEGRAKNRRTEFRVIGEINLVEDDD